VTPAARTALAAAVAVALAAGIFAVAAEFARRPAPGTYAAPGLPPMSVEEALAPDSALVPALLVGVYAAFAEAGEDAVYDALAEVADGAALEALYLERMGAMAGGGLVEATQSVHDIRMVRSETGRDGGALQVEAVWDVVGSLAHEEHVHMLGSRYRGTLTIAPRAQAWKITAFALADADRSRAGQTVEAEHR
jgi:hypothetical protein